MALGETQNGTVSMKQTDKASPAAATAAVINGSSNIAEKNQKLAKQVMTSSPITIIGINIWFLFVWTIEHWVCVLKMEKSRFLNEIWKTDFPSLKWNRFIDDSAVNGLFIVSIAIGVHISTQSVPPIVLISKEPKKPTCKMTEK